MLFPRNRSRNPQGQIWLTIEGVRHVVHTLEFERLRKGMVWRVAGPPELTIEAIECELPGGVMLAVLLDPRRVWEASPWRTNP